MIRPTTRVSRPPPPYRLRRLQSPLDHQAIEDTIEEVADRVIDRASGLGECDFAVEIAAPFPLEIICDMMGVPPSEYATVLRCSNVILSGGDPEYVPADGDPVGAFINAGVELTELMNALSAQRVENPADDLTTALITTNIDGEALTAGELASFFILLLTAGNETTRNAITHGLWAFTEHPNQRALWQSDPATVGATGVDEIVRWASPVIWMRRTVNQDTVLSGQELHPGDKMLLFYNSANRQTSRRSMIPSGSMFAEKPQSPPRIRGGRAPLLPGGPPGPPPRSTPCCGSCWSGCRSDIEAAGEPDRLRSSFINGIKHLSCRFSPR